MKNRKLQLNRFIFLFVSAIILFACHNRPSYVLSDKKMENVLFDIYLAEGEVNLNYELFNGDSIRKQELLNSVLKKHKISEAVLDSSIAWYSENLKDYRKINENLVKRYKIQLQALRDLEAADRTEKVEGMIELPMKNDSSALLTLLTIPGKIYPFESDTLMQRYGGAYEVTFNVLGINDLNPKPELTLCVWCADTVYKQKTEIKTNGLFMENIQLSPISKFEKVSGYIYFPEMSPQTQLFLSDFRIAFYSGGRPMRNHKQMEEPDIIAPAH